MKNYIALINNHTLFVEGATDRITAAQILEENTNASPLGLMFAGAGTLALKFVEGHGVTVPYRKIRLTDPSVTVQNMILEAEGTALEGVGIGVPDDAVRLHCAFKAATEGVQHYNVKLFLDQYLGDLERIGTLFMPNVDTARIDGMMAQVLTSPLVREDEVHLGPAMMKKLHKALIAAGHLELKGLDTLDGMIVLLQRYPVVVKTGGRWVTLRLTEGAPADKIMVNPKTWKELQDGDDDGDGGYVGISGTALFGEVADLLPYPVIKVMARTDLPETKPADQVQTVMNMMARMLVGSQHTFFHGIARAAAVKAARHAPDPKAVFRQKYCDVFDIYHSLVEGDKGVFNMRKSEDGGSEAFNLLVWAMEDHLAGQTLMVEPFLPFIEHDHLKESFKEIMGEVGHSTRLARGTVWGRHLMSSNQINSKKAAFSFIVDALADIDPLKMLAVIQADGLGEKIRPVEMPQVSGKRRKKPEEIKLSVATEIHSIQEVFETITLDGRPVCKVIGTDENTDGSLELAVRIIPVWKPGEKSPIIRFDWPALTKVPGLPDTEEHRLVTLEGMNTRMFCPIFRMVDGNLCLVDFKLWFAQTLASGIETFIQRMGKLDKEKMQAHMDRHMRSAIRNLIVLNGKDARAAKREQLVRMFEYRVEVPDGTMSGKSERVKEILTALDKLGYDVTTTSKNKPGTIVTKPWKLGVPRFIWAINPFANDLDAKRKVEPREVRKALELLNPIPPPLITKNAKIPAELLDVITTLNVAFLDLEHLNIFKGSNGEWFCVDTLLVTAAGIEKLKLRKLIFHANDLARCNQIVEKLSREGFAPENIKVEEVDESAGNGLHHLSYDIVALGEIEDIGKIKSCIGPIKGVMNPVPFQLFGRDKNGRLTEIDLIVPHDTLVRKRAKDVSNYIAAVHTGMTMIDPDNQPVFTNEDVESIKSEVYAILPDGTKVDLGTALAGPLPFFRPVQTGRSTTDIRTGEHGIKVQTHTMIMAGGVDFRNMPDWVNEDFAQIVNCRKEVKRLMGERTLAAQEETAPMPEEAPAEYMEA